MHIFSNRRSLSTKVDRTTDHCIRNPFRGVDILMLDYWFGERRGAGVDSSPVFHWLVRMGAWRAFFEAAFDLLPQAGG
jgi:hypothetical protein